MQENKREETARVYLGPSYYGIVQKGTVFRGQLPPKLEALIKGIPFLEGLLVPVENLAESRKALRREGSELNALYKRAEEKKQDRKSVV